MSHNITTTAASGDMQTYQIRTTPTTTSLPQTVVMTSPVTLTSQTSKTDDPQLKREIRLMKNRYVSALGLLWLVGFMCWNTSSKDKLSVLQAGVADCAIGMVCCIQWLKTSEIFVQNMLHVLSYTIWRTLFSPLQNGYHACYQILLNFLLSA